MNFFNLPGLRKFEYRYGPFLNGNTLGFEVNKNWRNFSKYCSSKYISSANQYDLDKAQTLKRDGLAILDKVDVTLLSKKVYQYFQNDDSLFSQMDLENQIKLTDDIYDILCKVKNPVQEYFQSHFRPYWISIQKTSPGKASTASSFGWHIDDNPKQMIKLFVYLNDVKESNGAFRAFPWKVSKKILKEGFRSNSEEVRTRNHSKIDDFLLKNPDSIRILEGEKGTVLGFDNNLVHKGTAPREGFRLAIQIPVIPSPEPLMKKDVESALISSRKRDYPKNPFVKEFGDK